MRWAYALCIGLTFASVLLVDIAKASDFEEPVYTENVEENSNLTVVCNNTEFRELMDFYWVVNDTDTNSSAVVTTGQYLQLIYVVPEEAGLYVCHALENATGENVTVMFVRVEVETPDEDSGRSVKLGVAIGCGMLGLVLLVLVGAALAKRRSKANRFPDKFDYSMRTQYGNSTRSGRSVSIKARYGTLDDSRSTTLDGSQTAGYPRIVYKKEKSQLTDSMT